MCKGSSIEIDCRIINITNVNIELKIKEKTKDFNLILLKLGILIIDKFVTYTFYGFKIQTSNFFS